MSDQEVPEWLKNINVDYVEQNTEESPYVCIKDYKLALKGNNYKQFIINAYKFNKRNCGVCEVWWEICEQQSQLNGVDTVEKLSYVLDTMEEKIGQVPKVYYKMILKKNNYK